PLAVQLDAVVAVLPRSLHELLEAQGRPVVPEAHVGDAVQADLHPRVSLVSSRNPGPLVRTALSLIMAGLEAGIQHLIPTGWWIRIARSPDESPACWPCQGLARGYATPRAESPRRSGRRLGARMAYASGSDAREDSWRRWSVLFGTRRKAHRRVRLGMETI